MFLDKQKVGFKFDEKERHAFGHAKSDQCEENRFNKEVKKRL